MKRIWRLYDKNREVIWQGSGYIKQSEYTAFQICPINGWTGEIGKYGVWKFDIYQVPVLHKGEGMLVYWEDPNQQDFYF